MEDQADDGWSHSSSTSLSEEALAALQKDLAAGDLTGGPKSLTERYLKLHQAHNKLHTLHNDTNERLNKFERRLNKGANSASSSSIAPSTISELSDLEDDHQLGYEENTIPETRDTNFELFKNRYGDADGKNCIEVLVAGSDFEEQVRQELRRRGELDEDIHKRQPNFEDADDAIIRRVRIQSPALLFLLCKAMEHSNVEWKGQNRTTFYRPFSWFIYVHDKMKDELKRLEENWSRSSSLKGVQDETVAETVARLKPSISGETANEASSASEAQGITPIPSAPAQNTKRNSLAGRTDSELLQKALLENYHTLLELRCYTEFVEQRILPLTRAYDDQDRPGVMKIRYQDLWYLFQHGELVVLQRQRRGSMFGNVSRGDMFIGQCLMRKPAGASAPQDPYYLACQPRKKRNLFNVFHMSIWTIDYNGEEFGRLEHPISIHFFEGLREITTLPVYPLRFHKERDELRKSFGEIGSRFKEAVDFRHMAYQGWSRPWTARPPPPGRPGVSVLNQQQQVALTPTVIRNSTYIESDVIVDVSEAIRAFPDSPIHFPTYQSTIQMHACQDLFEIIKWSDERRTEKLSIVQDRTQTADAVWSIEEIRAKDADPFIMRHKDYEFTEQDILLLPDRIYAYALRERKFFQAEVRYLRRLQADTDAFESLKIDPEHIHIVQAVVASHFQRKTLETRPEFATMMDQDLIRGKGRGLVILLHGAPGVGKTATAEAVALSFKRPLFVITCGDLGFTPQGVETSLSEIFRLAHLWNCILLLDEADVFLSQREANALERNALVSVFLRVLEYYNGILFLTTNRVGTLDEAFKSRVHLSLYYPALSRTQTEEITRMNLVRLRTIEEQRSEITGDKPLYVDVDGICKFSTEHWGRHTEHSGAGRWNGRQIRNAVQIAASLAWYDRKNDRNPGAEELPPTLDERHFRIVERTMTLFEGYMTKAKGGNDTYLAEQRSERYDRFRNPGSNSGDEHRPQASGPDPFGSAGGRGIGGYYPYQSGQQTPQQPQWPQQQVSNMAGPSGQHMTGSPYAGSPGQPYQQTQPHHQPQTGFGAPAHLTPSPSFSSMRTDQRPHMSSGGIGPQAYSQSQIPQLSPQGSYMASGTTPTPEQSQGASYHQTGHSAPRSSQPPYNDMFGSVAADTTYRNSPGGSSLSEGQPSIQQQGQWNIAPETPSQRM